VPTAPRQNITTWHHNLVAPPDWRNIFSGPIRPLYPRGHAFAWGGFLQETDTAAYPRSATYSKRSQHPPNFQDMKLWLQRSITISSVQKLSAALSFCG